MEPRPEDLNAWVNAGFARGEAAVWRRWGFTVSTARAWISAGVTTGLTAAQWAIAGVTPSTVAGWRDAGISPADAVRWHEFGVGLRAAAEFRARGITPEQAWSQRTHGTDDPADIEVVHRWREAGVAGPVLSSYLLRQWLDDAALEWARQGVDAADAMGWRELGLTAAEGGELARSGRRPVAELREWWRVGIPFEEVADWLGAGLGPDEAAGHRANGVTVEQASRLRDQRRRRREREA